MVRPTQLSVLRMIPVARRIARKGGGRLAVYRLLNSSRGWDSETTPVHDVQWALGEVQGLLGQSLPVCLVGHSLGGRAALLAARHESVTSVAALNPYLYPQDGRVDLTGRRVLIVHGTADRVARLDTAAVVAEMLGHRTSVTFLPVPGGKHAMLAHHREFTEPAADFAAATLLNDAAGS